MTASEIEKKIIFEEYAKDAKTDSTLFRSTFSIEYFSRVSNTEIQAHTDPAQVKGHILKISREHIMRKLYDDQREALYKALYDLRACNPTDYIAFQNCIDAVIEAALRQQPNP